MTISEFFQSGFVGKYFFGHPEETSAIVLMVISAVVVMVAAYLLGSINFAIIISGKQYKQDIRQFGSKNAGMTNMMRTYGKKAAGFTLLGDALKAVVSCLIGYALLGHLGSYIAGLFCIVGHIFPVFYKFKGGKGVVTTAIAILMCDPFVFLVLIVLFVIIVAFTKYISLGSVICVMLYPILLDRFSKLFSGASTPYAVFAIIIAILVVAKHWTNIKRLMQGKESKFSFKKSVKSSDISNDDSQEQK